MSNIFSLLAIFIIIIFYKFLSNLIKKNRLDKLIKQYHEHMISKAKNENPNDFIQNIEEMKMLLINSGQHSYQIPNAENIGYGLLSTAPIDLFNNMTFCSEYIISSMLLVMQKSIGVYKKRMREAFSLFYWVEYLIYLPSNIIKYCGGKKDSSLSRFLNVIYWLVDFFAIALSLSNSDLFAIFKNFFINLLQ